MDQTSIISLTVLYRTTITKLLEDYFGAEVKHAKKGNKVDFNYDKLQKIQKSYDTTVNIKTTLEGIEHSTSEPTPLAEIDHNIVLDPKGEGGERPRESAPISGGEI